MSKTTKIIIAIAVLAAVVIAWKKGLFKAFGSDAKTTDELEKEYEADLEVTTSDPDAFNKELKQFVGRQKALMKKIGLDPDVRHPHVLQLVKNIYIWCHDDDESNWTAANMVKNARNNGRTVDQQYLASALWAMSDEGWSDTKLDPLPARNKQQYESLMQKLSNL